MRYFVAKNGSTVVEKQAVSGDDVQVDALVAKYRATHPTLVVEELDQTTFDSTAYVPPLTPAQAAWATFKASSPTAPQAIAYLAKVLGLE